MKQNIQMRRNSWLVLAWCLMIGINILQLVFYKWRITPEYAWSKVFTKPILIRVPSSIRVKNYSTTER